MNKKIEMVGKKQGMLRVISESHKESQGYFWECVCECGEKTVVLGQKLRNGHTKSCGCLQAIRVKESNTIHGMAHSRLSNIHSHMKRRCKNKNNASFKDYGGRGIEVCEEWEEFKDFAKWALENGYKDTLTIERIDNDGDYEPGNCMWIPFEKQVLNRRIPKTNKSGYPGVFFDKRINKYTVTVKESGKQKYLGSFKRLLEAIEVKRSWEMETHNKHLYEMPTNEELAKKKTQHVPFAKEVAE